MLIDQDKKYILKLFSDLTKIKWPLGSRTSGSYGYKHKNYCVHKDEQSDRYRYTGIDQTKKSYLLI